VSQVQAHAIAGLYSRGLFPMDEPGAADLPWWTADPRTVLGLEAEAIARARRTVRRSMAVAERAGASWRLRRDGALDEVISHCGRPRGPGDGVWLTPRMHELYRTLHRVGACHTYEIWVDGRLAAGLVAVTLRRAAMLDSMFHRVSHAGNALVVWTLEALAGSGYELCDLQTSTPHTRRLGAYDIPREEYERRLAAALR
jgi:leucyl/phenylalanyl-tRNA--protein transferase